MPSKLVIAREKSALAVASAATTHAASVAARFGDQFAGFLEAGETMPDVEALLRLIGRGISQTSDALTSADKTHELELADDVEYRVTRDEALAELRSVLIDMRSLVSTGYGRAGLVKLGLAANTPTDASAVFSLGRSVLAEISNPTLVLPEARRSALKLDREAFTNDLRDALARVEASLADMAREDREAEATLMAKHAAMERYDQVFSRGAGLISALFSAADLDQLAARVRPSRRSPGRTVDEGDIEDTPDDTSDDGDASRAPTTCEDAA